MKVQPINTHNIYSNKTEKQQQSFGAIVKIEPRMHDKISDFTIDLKQKGLDKMAESLKEKLLKMSDNLFFRISGAQTADISFFDLFKKAKYGLKVDIFYNDVKKAYYDIVNKKPEEQLLDQKYLKKLIDQDEIYLARMTENVRVGRIYEPKKETPSQYVESLFTLIKREVVKMPEQLLAENKVEKVDDLGNKVFDLDKVARIETQYIGFNK